MFDYFRIYSSNTHHVCCEYSPTKGLHDHCQSDDLDLHSRSQVRLKRDYYLICNISDNYNQTCIAVDLWMPYNYAHASFYDLDLDARS